MKIKEVLDILNKHSENIDVNDFYTISIWESQLQLQGYMNSELIKKLGAKNLLADENGIITIHMQDESTGLNIEYILT